MSERGPENLPEEQEEEEAAAKEKKEKGLVYVQGYGYVTKEQADDIRKSYGSKK